MSSTPFVRQLSLPLLAVQILFIYALYFVWERVSIDFAFLFTAITYWLIARVLRNTFGREHRIGIALVRKENYSEALPHFLNSYAYFEKNPWIDKFRGLTLMSASKSSYKEMALNNIAFCYGQLGEGLKAKEYYEKALQEFPKSGLAKSGLRMLTSMEQKQTI